MDPTHLRGRLADLFRTAGRAHHLAFLTRNGDDPGWPQWYAGYLHSKMTTLLGTVFTVEQLAGSWPPRKTSAKPMLPALTGPPITPISSSAKLLRKGLGRG